MPEINDKKPEPKKPEHKPDDSAAHTMSAFVQSLAYSAVEAPSRGVAQLIDHAATTHLDAAIQHKFENAGLHQPEAAAYGTHAWAAQQLGSAIGMMLPMKLSHKLMVGNAEVGLAGAAKLDATLFDKAVREAHSSAKAGLFYGTVFTPSNDQNNSGNFYLNRLKQGANTAITFGAMGASSAASSEMLGRAATALESKPIHSLFKSPLQTALSSSLVHGAISGIPGGAIQAQLNAMENGKPFASLQDIKESVVSMTMVGGAMGSAGLFKETTEKRPLSNNIEALRLDSIAHPLELRPATIADTKLEVINPIAGIDTVSSKFDIKFEPVADAWKPEDVNKHMTVETRSLEFANPNRTISSLFRGKPEDFAQWGVRNRDVPSNVYRFPGVDAEIVVPAEHARVLDQIRLQRLDPDGFNSRRDASVTDEDLNTYRNSPLPEQIAQLVKQLPAPDLVKRVELHGQEDPWDYHRVITAKAEGKRGVAPALASATVDGSGVVKFFKGANVNRLQSDSFHEWSHLAQSDSAFAAFSSAASIERKGFYARPYAKENNDENWAVHLGERFLNPSGSIFAELPESAPARSLIMDKALRNMLEARSDNPSPKHGEFLARVSVAEDVSTKLFRDGLVADLRKGDGMNAGAKIRFLNETALSADSPDVVRRILGSIDSPTMQALGSLKTWEAHQLVTIAHATDLASDYQPEKMPAFLKRWDATTVSETKEGLYQILPEPARQAVLEHMLSDVSKSDQTFLTNMVKKTDGATRDALHKALDSSRQKFEGEALSRSSRGKELKDGSYDWLVTSDKPEARFAALLNSTPPVSFSSFAEVINGLNSSGLKQMIAQGALEHVISSGRYDAWENVLQRMSQSEHVQLFSDLADLKNPVYKQLANQISEMTSAQFSSASRQIVQDAHEIFEGYGEIQSRLRPAATTDGDLGLLDDHPASIENPLYYKKFDIPIARIDTAWPQENVDQYKTLETRKIDYIPENRDALVAQGVDWTEFTKWGVEEREVPVHVYRFPGVATEIVVPADHAQFLDQVRDRRLNPPEPEPYNPYSSMAANDNHHPTEKSHVLPEEIAQMLQQLPHPDLVKSVQLLGHSDPWDLQKTYEDRKKAIKAGKSESELPPSFVALADANISGLGRIRYFQSTSNNPRELHWTTSHEWAHLAENDVAFKAFGAAARVERDGFFARDYARENTHENWAVHFGERFLSPEGTKFAELPHEAPARTLVIAKALRNMLAARGEDAPRSQEFLARAQAAEDIAAKRLQDGILKDVEAADHDALFAKLRFLNVAVSGAKSPEIFSKVLDPISEQLLPALQTAEMERGTTNEFLANSMAQRLAKEFSPDMMPEFMRRWHGIKRVDGKAGVFSSLPEVAREQVLRDLVAHNYDTSPGLLHLLIKNSTSDAEREKFQKIREVAQAKFEGEGLEHYERTGEVSPEYAPWLNASDNPQARLTMLASRKGVIMALYIDDLTRNSNSPQLLGLVMHRAFERALYGESSKAFESILARLPQGEQAALFKELGQTQSPDYARLADSVSTMTPAEFLEKTSDIKRDAVKILEAQESTPEFILRTPDRIMEADAFADASKHLSSEQAAQLFKSTKLSNAPGEVDDVVSDLKKNFDAQGQLDVIASIDPAVQSSDRLYALSELMKSSSSDVASRATRLFMDVANTQLKTLKERAGEPGRYSVHDGQIRDGIVDQTAYDSVQEIEYQLLKLDDAQARITYANAQKLNPTSGFLLEAQMSEASYKLSDAQMIQFLRSGITQKLSPYDTHEYLTSLMWDATPAVRAQIRRMGYFGEYDDYFRDNLGDVSTAHPLDLQFAPIENAWEQQEVEKYRTNQTRSVEFAAPERDTKIDAADWSKFQNWGVESRAVSVDVYRFPGLTTDIEVPSDYARILDRIREQRLDPSIPEDTSLSAYKNRILPEELAQVLRRLPNPDIIESAQLLNHASPQDLKFTHDRRAELALSGKPDPDFKHVSRADADYHLARVRFFDSSTNDPEQMSRTGFHEWSHLAQDSTAYNAFSEAAYAEREERNGFSSREYARTNDDENWAVHMGEHFLHPDGASFAEIPEKAPARALVMARALRQMLEAREHNPSPRHQEFLDRAIEADHIATNRLQIGILRDIEDGNQEALNEKLHFLNTAASSARSPEIFDNVLSLVEPELLPLLEARPTDDKIANQFLANRLLHQMEAQYDPTKMPEFRDRFMRLLGTMERDRFFRAVPEDGQQILCDALLSDPSESNLAFLSLMVARTEGASHDIVNDTYNKMLAILNAKTPPEGSSTNF